MDADFDTAARSVAGLFQEAWPDSYRFFQLGFLVEDLRASALRWVEVYGVGPFYFMKRRVQTHAYRGATIEVEVELCVSQAGPVQIELIELFTEGANIYREVFPTGGGLHQLCSMARDYDATVAHYSMMGCPLVNEISSGPFRVGYIDTRREFGFVTEVVEHTPAFQAQVAKIAEICAGWDGRDPLRYMTRDGYRPA